MSWPQKIKEEVLVACGRHCCICHKFCGLKIELHHIKQRAEGGKDIFENCIPLCFDCHADQRSYDHKHPKGTKYSEEELVLHRDSWYRKVKDSAAITRLPDYLHLDKQLFLRIKEMLPFMVISELIKVDTVVIRHSLTLVYRLIIEANDPDFSFLDSDLEGQFTEFIMALDEFYGHLVRFNGIHKNNPDIFLIKFCPESERQKSSSLAYKLENVYLTFIKTARRKLAV